MTLFGEISRLEVMVLEVKRDQRALDATLARLDRRVAQTEQAMRELMATLAAAQAVTASAAQPNSNGQAGPSTQHEPGRRHSLSLGSESRSEGTG